VCHTAELSNFQFPTAGDFRHTEPGRTADEANWQEMRVISREFSTTFRRREVLWRARGIPANYNRTLAEGNVVVVILHPNHHAFGS